MLSFKKKSALPCGRALLVGCSADLAGLDDFFTLDAFNLCADAAELFDDVLVAALNIVDI